MNIEVVVESRRAALSGSDFSRNSCSMEALDAAETRDVRGLVIADSNIEDAAVLLEQLEPGTELWWVDAWSDFEDTLHDVLSAGYDKLHFVGHGQPGSITLGGKALEAEDFTALSGAQVQAPSIHFWSCMTGAGAKGRAFVHSIAETFGSVVTAFSGLVGAGNKGGSWLPDIFSHADVSVPVPFVNAEAYAHTLLDPPSPALKLISVVTETGIDVQVRLTAGTVIDNADLVLSYDPSKAIYTGATGNPALTGWSWASNLDKDYPGHLLIDGFSLTSINSTSDIVLARISFTLSQGSTDFGASLASGTLLSVGDSSVELGTLPTLDNILISSAPVWQPFTPPDDLSYAAGTTVSIDLPVYATDPNGDTITYKAFVGQMVGTTFFGLAGVPQIPLTLSNGHLTGSSTVPAQGTTGSYVLRVLADDNATDTNNGTALDVPFSVIHPVTIDFNGTPTGTPSGYESFQDFILDTTKQSLPGYLASFAGESSTNNKIHIFDVNNDGIPDSFTENWTDVIGAAVTTSGSIIWDAHGIFVAQVTAGGTISSQDNYGRLAYDAQGNVVGLYSLDINPVGTLTPDTTAPHSVATFTIPYTSGSWLLLNGEVDHLTHSSTYFDENNVQQTETDEYAITWSDTTHFTARIVVTIDFGTTFDSQGRPTTISYYTQTATGTDVLNEIPVVWQTKDADNVVATFELQNALSGKFIDTNGDNLPDKVSYTSTHEYGSTITYTGTGTLAGWSSLSSTHPHVSMEVQTSTDPSEFFTGTVTGSNSNPTTLAMPLYFMGSDLHQYTDPLSYIPINTTGSVNGTPLSNESYYTFHSGTGVLATVGDNGFNLNLTADTDNNPVTFHASWSWLNSSGQISQTSTGVLTFQDTDTSQAGPEQWSATLKKVNTGVLVADGADSDTLPDGFVVGDDMHNDVSVPLVWQAKDTNNVIATFTATVKNSNNFDITFSGALKDTNSDNKPDTIAGTWGSETFNLPFSFTDTDSNGTPDHWRMIESEIQSGRVQVDASGNPAGLYLPNSNNSGVTIDFNGTPTGTPASYEVFLDFYQSTPTPSLTGYQASFQSIWKDALGLNVTSTWGVFDTNGDGIGDSYTETYTHAGTQTTNSGTIIWSANSIFYSHQTAGDTATAKDGYGRLAYDAQGDVVGLYAFHLTPYTLVSDTNPDDKLISSFTISSETVKLFDDDGNGVIDRMEQTGTDPSGLHTETNNYSITWTDTTHWTAHYTETLTFGSSYDGNGRPTTLWLNGNEQAIVWETTVVDNVVARVSFINNNYNNVLVPAVLTFIDSDNDQKPDQVVYKDATDEEHANLVGWTFDANNHPTGVTIVIQSMTLPEVLFSDLFSGIMIGSSSNPTTILMPSFENNNNISINVTGTIEGTPLLPREGYYKFYPSTGLVATVGDNGFHLNLMNDTDNNPLTFNASLSWMNAPGTGVLTFQDTDISKAGPEQWTATLDFNEKNMPLIADGSDAGTAPDGFMVSDAKNNLVNVPLTWQERDANHVIATFTATLKNDQNQDVTLSGSLIDDNNDTLPDRAVGYDGSGSFDNAVRLVDTNNDGVFDALQRYDVEMLSGRVQVDTSGNPAGLYVVNHPPTGLVTISGMPTQGQTLTVANTLQDMDSITGAIHYQWQANGANLDGATSAAYTLTEAEVGKQITVAANYTDGLGKLESVISGATSAVVNVNDAPKGFVGINGDPLQGKTLEAWYYLSDGDFPNGIIPPEAIHYQWQADGVNISGATTATLVLGEALVDKTITVNVSYTDPHGIQERVSSYESLTIENVNDPPTGAVTIQGTVAKGQTLAANISTLADADGLGYIYYQWYAGTKELLGATDNTYTPTLLEVGKTISVTASYWDGHGTWESVTSAATSPVNDNTNNPATGTVTISGTPTQNKTLIANFNIVDVDGVSGSVYAYQWQADGVAITGATNRNYQLKEAEVGKKLTVTVSFNDDAGYHESLTSSATRAVVNVNDPPAGTVTIHGTAAEDQILTADIRALTDADGLGPISYQWQADGGNIAGATESSYTLTQGEVGTKITVVASYTDGHGTFESKSSAATVAVANVNDAPSLFAGETLIIGSAVVGEELFVNSGELSDEDGPDVLSITSYQWQADGIKIDGATDSSYVLTSADAGKSISVKVTYTDAFNNPEQFTSAATAAVVTNAHPQNGSIAISGNLTQGETLTATVNDVDGFGTITYQWRVNTGSAAAPEWTNIAGATGATLLLKEALVGKQLQVSASYTDNKGTIESPDSSATAAVANVNDNPAGNVTITGTAKQGETLIAGNTLADLDGIPAGAITYKWQANGSDIAGAAGDHYTLKQAEVGKTITVIAHYTDGHGYEENVPSASTVAVINSNDFPTGIVKITGSGQQGEMLTASNTLADADGMGTVSYQWQANGVNISGAENDSYQLTQEEVGKAITVTASYTDGGGTLESVRSVATSSILNVNDRPTGGVTIDGNAKQGQRLTVNTSALYDADGMPAQALLNYQWQAGGLNIDGANSSSYLLTQSEVGKAITVKVSYIDLQGTSESVRSGATGNVANVNDLPTGTVTIRGTPTQGETLSATNNLVDRDGPPTLAISYQWQADGVDIAGAVDSYYELTQSDVGKRMAVVASYTDAFTKAEHVSSIATAAIANINDAPTGTITISGNASQGQTLTANTMALSDVDGLGSFSYQWQAGGVNITGAINSSYTLTNSEVDKPIKVIVSYTDGFGKAESVISSQTRLVRNTNDAPTGSVTITGTPTQNATLTASNTLADADGLGDITYQWQADGETIDGATEGTYKLTQDEVGKRITVVASYTDGHGTLESIPSAVTALVANVNDPPTGTVTVSGTATQGQTLTVTNSIADIDGLGAISYQWTAAGSNISGAYGSSLTLTESQLGKKIAVVASYTDGQGHPESVSSNNTATVKNLNDAPQGEVTISGVLKVGKTLSADNTLTDADGLGAISYQWKANGKDIDGATDREYTLTTAEKGQTMSVVASYTDGHGFIESIPSAATTPVTVVIRGSAHDGYLVNALVWVDDNNNAVRDWTDLNHNGIWDEGEGESWTLTDSTGQFAGLEGTGVLRITANPNGATIDISTGNDFTGSFAAPSDSTVISALTTLVAATIDGTTDVVAAAAKVKTALALDASVTITSYDPIAEASKTTTSDAARLVAIRTQSATIQVNNIMDVAVSVAQAASATANTAQIVENVADSLLAQAAQSVSGTVNLADSTVITKAINAGISLGAIHTPSADVVNAIATALALVNSEIAHTADTATGTIATAVADITAIVKAQIVAQNTIVTEAYTAVTTGDAAEITTHATNFDALLTEASGQVETIFVNHQPTGNVTISGVVMPGETLTASNSLADVEGVGAISYQWLRGGVAIADATHETYALTTADIGTAITVKASYTDGAGHHESVNSDPTALLPDAPTSLSDVVVGADHLTNNTTPTVTVDLTHKALEVGEIIQIIDSNHDNIVVSSHTITTQDLTILTAQDIDLLVSLVGFIDDTHALKVQLVDSASHAGLGSNSITAVTVDTTLPTITHPAYASGVVTATLDAALETGDKLYGSLDNGIHWSDITGDITGTAINWDGISITNDSKVQLKVTDAAGNESTTNVPLPPVSGYNLTVHTNYWNNDKAMHGVTVDSGSLTDNLGAAIFNNVPAGTKTLTPVLTASQEDKSAVDLLDAITILKSIVGLTTLNGYQQVAADFNKDSSVDLVDAIGILKHVVGLTAPTPEWAFVATTDLLHDPAHAIAVDVIADTTVDLIGILRGDVDGSWSTVNHA